MRLEAQDMLQQSLVGLPQHASPVVDVGGALTALVGGVKATAGVGLQARLEVLDGLGDVVRVLLDFARVDFVVLGRVCVRVCVCVLRFD